MILANATEPALQRSVDALVALGAQLWSPAEFPDGLSKSPAPLHLATTKQARRGASRGGPPILSLTQVSVSDYLTHCTRHVAGPWPDQSVADYRDSLILDRADSDHGPLATLMRIVQQQRLLASAKAIRGGSHVVCFAAVPLPELQRLHQFRPHRGRWDFEPYGICIRTGWLRQRGARPVRYGEAELFEQLPESDRPYFQRRTSGQHDQIDWSVEREWRHVGNVDLSDLLPDDAFLFVPTLTDAARLAPLSRWPIAVLS